MTDLIYNGIHIKDVLTNGITYEPVTAPGGDLLYIRAHVSVIGTIRVPQTSARIDRLGVMVNSLGPDSKSVCEALSIPRRRFTMLVGGQAHLDIAPAAAERSYRGATNKPQMMEVNNGPVPRARLLGFTAHASARVEFECELAILPCTNIHPSGVTALRYWVGEEYDGKDWHCTRTYEGFLRLAHRGINLHALRALYPFIPPVQRGFDRSKVRFQPSEDGLELRFVFQDVENHAAPPFPSTEFECEYHVGVGKHFIQATAEIRCQLWSNRNVPKTNLHALAQDIIERKLHIEDHVRSKSLFLENIAISETYKKNRVEHVARIRAFPYDRTGPFGIFKDELGKELWEIGLPGYDRDEPSRAARVTAGPWGLFLNMLQSPCDPDKMPQVDSSGYPDPEKETKAGQEHSYETEPKKTLTARDTLADESQKDSGAYAVYRSTSDIKVNTGSITLPVGKSSGGATSKSIQLHQGHAKRHVRIEGERLGAWPVLPEPVSFKDGNGIMHNLEHWRPIPHAARTSADGQKLLYAIDAEFRYGLSRVPGSGDSLPVGQLPYYVDLGPESRTYPPEFFTDPKKLLT